MRKSLLELDPDADALLILQRPNLQQVRPYSEEELSAWGDDVQEKKKAEPATTDSPAGPTITEATDLKEITSLQPEQKDGTTNEIVFRVSAKHLSMVSPVFRRMIKGNFKESQPNDQGLLEIRTSEWNAQALLILLDIIHCHHSHVPKALSQEIVAHIGLIADYYDCVDIVKVFYEGWEARFCHDWGSDWPDSANHAFAKFGRVQQFQLFIVVTFQSDLVFGYLATHAILTATGPIETYLPVPRRISERLDQRRISLLAQLFKRLYNLQRDLLEEPGGCDEGSHARLLGHLMREMWKAGLPMERPAKPFAGFSVSSVAECIRSIRIPPAPYHEGMRDSRKLEKRLKFDVDQLYQQTARMSLKDVGIE